MSPRPYIASAFRLPVIILICLLGLILDGKAQETPTARTLVQPSAQDYLRVVDEVIAHPETTYDFTSWDGAAGTVEIDALSDEIDWRLIESSQMSYGQILTLYRTFAAAEDPLRPSSVDDRLIPSLIEGWLAENPTNFDTTRWLTFDGFTFEVLALWNRAGGFSLKFSFSALTTPFRDALYHIGFSGGVASFIVVQNADGSYQVPPLPVPMFGHVIHTGDFNGDSQQDFTYVNYTHDGNSYVSGALVIVTWTGTAFEILDRVSFRHGPGFDAGLTWKFMQFDDDEPQELVTTQHLFDNWNCDFVRVSYFDWQEDGRLGYDGGQDVFPRNFNCLLRQAEERAWQHQYAEAVPLYEEVFNHPANSDYLVPFAHMRLGLAYLLTAQTDAARDSFLALMPSEETTDANPWIATVRDVYVRDPRLLPLCQTIYNQATDIYSADPYRGYTIDGTIFALDGGFYGPGWYDPGFDRENISCDLPFVLGSALRETSFTTVTTPVEQLETLGITVGDSITADFDADGDEDWLVWLDAMGIDPLMFVAHDTAYTVTVMEGLGSGDSVILSADLSAPDEFNTYRVVTLPDQSVALVNVDFGREVYGDPEIICVGSDPTVDPPRGRGGLSLWHLEGNQLELMFSALLCPWGDNAALMPGGDGSIVNQLLAGDYFAVGEWEFELRPVTYTWDETQHTFVPPPQPSPTPFTPTPTAQPPTLPAYHVIGRPTRNCARRLRGEISRTRWKCWT